MSDLPELPPPPGDAGDNERQSLLLNEDIPDLPPLPNVDDGSEIPSFPKDAGEEKKIETEKEVPIRAPIDTRSVTTVSTVTYTSDRPVGIFRTLLFPSFVL